MALTWERTIDVAPHMFGGRVDPNDDWLLFTGKWLIGRVYRQGAGPHRGAIGWSLTGPVTPQAPGPMAGSVDTIQDGQEQLLSAWRRWLPWAELEEAAAQAPHAHPSAR